MRKIFNITIYVFAAIGFILLAVFVAVNLGWTKTSGIIDRQHDYFKNQSNTDINTSSILNPDWAKSEEWTVLKSAILKDKTVINKVSQETGISARLIVAILIVEQLRLFNDNREIFKTIFAPLKILGNQSQFSWGVMGIKQDTAKQIESNLKDNSSPWYLEEKHNNDLDYPATSTDIDSQRFARLTDEHNRYYSYLYGALYVAEIESQWEKAGFNISNRPEILATLFNIGFQHSKPNSNPQIGGAEITIGTSTYSFGGLAGNFYYSDELSDEFPNSK